METGLADRVVLITGASGGIGQTLVKAFLAEGARVIAHYRTQDAGAQAALEGAGTRGIAVGADLTAESEVQQLFAEAERHFGSIDILVANAGYWPPQDVPLTEMTLQQWNHTLAVDLTAVFLCAREFFRNIQRHHLVEPAAVLIGSTAAVFGESNHADYASAKAGVTYGLARSLKNEIARLAPRGRVNVVCPGWTVTPMVDKFAADPERVRRVLQTIPLRKLGRPDDVAAAVVFLASTRLAGHITGEILMVSGGMEGRVLYPPGELDWHQA
jgi:3-oxoacyl-[acyl-carrier protein] reductase